MDGETFIFDEEFGNKKLSLNPLIWFTVLEVLLFVLYWLFPKKF